MGIEQDIIYKKLKSYQDDDIKMEQGLVEKFDSIDSITRDARNDIGFDYYQPVTSNKRFIGKFIVAYKRFVRRSITWIIEPILRAQTDKNYRYVQMMYEITDALKTIQKDVAKQDQELADRIHALHCKVENTMMQDNEVYYENCR